MIKKLLTISLFALAVGVPGGFAFTPVMIIGSDLDVTVEPDAPDAVVVQPAGGLSFLFSWRESMERGGYMAADGSAVARSPVDGVLALSDSEDLSIELGLPIDEDELILQGSVRTSFLLSGVSRLFIEPGWRVDYQFATETGWIGLLASGRYQFNSSANDVFSHDVGLGFLISPSIRLSSETSARIGYENWPEHPLFDNSGSSTGETRKDLTLTLESRFRGLRGFFTTWDLAGLAETRFSTANDYVEETGTLVDGSENRVAGELSASLNTSPSRRTTFTLAGVLRDAWYFNKELVSGANRLSASASLGVDLTPADGLYVTSTFGGLATFLSGTSEVGWNLTAGVGVEYSF